MLKRELLLKTQNNNLLHSSEATTEHPAHMVWTVIELFVQTTTWHLTGIYALYLPDRLARQLRNTLTETKHVVRFKDRRSDKGNL